VGTKETVTDRLQALSDVGIDGTLLTFVRWHSELRDFVSVVMPALVDKGLRVA
jgi:alkanesulfonate monooxygenase SsuD/methylene tetrahydromethanopterin reductase-like flavin-dependent oxidoreductase (luciferase family)